MEVLLVVNCEDMQNQDAFEEHLESEGFLPIEDEPFAYGGVTSTSLMNTETFILHVTKEALSKTEFSTCNIIFQVGENPIKAFGFNKNNKEFNEVSPQE